MIRRFTCSNFRNIEVEDLAFGRINLLIGPNNAGKSNFIRALSFSANMVNHAGKDTISGFLAEVQRNGSSAICRRGGHDEQVSLKWRIALKEEEVDYSLVFQPGSDENGPFIKKEAVDSAKIIPGKKRPFNFFLFHDEKAGYGMFSTARKKGKLNKRKHVLADQDESALLQFDRLVLQNRDLIEHSYVSKDLFGMLEEMRAYFSKFYAYMSSKFDLDKVRQLQDPNGNGNFLAKDGSNFLNVYRQACRSDPDFETRFFAKMQALITDLTEIRIVEGLDKIGMKLFMGQESYLLSEVSDGTIEALMLALLTSMPQKQAPTLLAIDEPEVNLHPAWQAVLAKWLQMSGNFKQCFISTHSSDLLDAFTEGFRDGAVDIFVYDQMGRNTFRPLDRERVNDELEKGWLLGDLYRVNDPSIGGWPW